MVLPIESHNTITISLLYGFICFIVTQAAVAKVAIPEGPEPSFAEPIPNVTVAAGRDVTLPCVVENLGNYRVAWIHTDRHTLLTLHDRLITRNMRYSISHNSHRTWWLHITDVEERDSGEYMCQINTSPMKSQVGYLEVVVPPKIEEENTSSDSEVREGGDIGLRCSASGSPAPKIKWRREDEKDITLGTKKVPSVHGEYLNISKTSRLHMGAYLCIASNGVPPSVSKRIMLKVNFAPMIWIPNQLIGAPLGTEVTLDCNLESFPRSITFWTRGGTMILSNNKYDSMIIDTGIYKVQMKLRIRNLRPDDFGSYLCVAKNSLGETEGTIRLYEIPRPMSSTTPRITYAGSKTEGTQQTSSEKIVIGTWQTSQTRDGNDVKKSEISGEVFGVETSVGFVPSAAGHDLAAQDTGRTETRDSPNKSTNISYSENQVISCIFLLLIKMFYSCQL
ncbi:lachesin-like [Centruroides sculpturatus]|uniref:lachesin-like n=1 Tax=Centruroides sculpturatus TaxID=218467 RepID=UPI000C6E79CB|nr:lachesin-like [Centruroides sculpturatus]